MSPRSPPSAPKSLHLDTRATADGPRWSASLNNSPVSSPSTASNVRPTPTEPAAERISKPNGIQSSTVTPSTPRANDPKLQEVFDAINKWCETSRECILLELRKDKLVKEGSRRQEELGKVRNKVDDFAPFSEFQRRFDESNRAEREDVDKREKGLGRQYQDNLERLVSCITWQASARSQAAAATENESISALEVRFADFQRQVSEQQRQISEAQAQIQTLLSEREKSTDAFNNLNNEFGVLRDSHNVLQSENLELRQQVADLEATKQATSEFRELKAQVEAQAFDPSGIQGDLSRLSKDLESFVVKVDGIENKVAAFMSKVRDLDMETYNEILEAWIDHDLKNKVLTNEKGMVVLRQDLKSLRNSAETWFKKSDSRIQDVQQSVEAIQNCQPAQPKPGKLESEDNQPVQKAFIEEKLHAFNKIMQKTIAESGDACAEMVDELDARVNKLAAIVDGLGQPKATSNDTDILARIDQLEQAATQQSKDIGCLETRVESLESQKLAPRVDSVDVGLADLEKKLRDFQQSYNNGVSANLDAVFKGIRAELENAKRRLEALELSTRTLDSQWSNLSSRQMAERIIQHLDPYGQRNEARVAGVEKELFQVEKRVQGVEENVLACIKDPSKLAELIKALHPDGKKRASPGPTGDEQTKKRKLDASVR
ncbi:hypothetical protein AAE478_005956 [Parahypoxylon ruwenzoriense]